MGNSWNPNPPQWYFSYKAGRENRQINDAAILRRGSKVFLCESWDDAGGSTGQAAWGVDVLGDGRPRLIHGTGSNVMCADGHGTRIALTGLTTRFSQNASNTPIQSDAMWFPLNGGTSTFLK